MKLILMSLVTFAAVFAFAQEQVETIPGPPQFPPQTIYVQATGSAFGQCDGESSSFCIGNIQRNAVENGSMQTQSQCAMRQGQIMGVPSCNSYCSPSYIAPGSPVEMVNCRSNCNAPCEIRM